MAQVNMKAVEAKAAEFGNDLEKVKSELKRLQSIKCRLKKQQGKANFTKEMTRVLQEEELMKCVRSLLDPKEKAVPDFTQEDVDRLDYDQTVKAIKAIQSKKSLTKWSTTVEGDNDDYRAACAVEEMLVAHRATVKPVEDSYIRKSDLVTVIETIESSGKLSQERILSLLKGLLK